MGGFDSENRFKPLWKPERGNEVKVLKKILSERVETEIQKLVAVLTELRNSIQKELAEPDYPVQLELFSTPEREQFEKNKDALRRRLEEIPAEIERETEAIRRRYSNPRPLLFPLAVTILFPQKNGEQVIF